MPSSPSPTRAPLPTARPRRFASRFPNLNPTVRAPRSNFLELPRSLPVLERAAAGRALEIIPLLAQPRADAAHVAAKVSQHGVARRAQHGWRREEQRIAFRPGCER